MGLTGEMHWPKVAGIRQWWFWQFTNRNAVNTNLIMANKLEFHFPVATLLKEGDIILAAGELYAPQLTDRLDPTFLTDTRALWEKVGKEASDHKISIGEVGSLTVEQKEDLKVVNELVLAAKKTAKKAFKGEKVKLHEEFQVGVNKPKTMAADLGRANIVLAALNKAENIPALKAEGWIAADTAKLETAIKSVLGVDGKQELGKGDEADALSVRNEDANALYRKLLALQNAANLQFPESDATNDGTRLKFRLGIFPPSGSHVSGTSPQPPQPPTPAPPSP